ncbi:MAG: DUF7220 family protein [Gelidibacter sp.]
MQTKLQSLIEVATSTVIGFIVSLIATFAIFPILDIASTPIKNFKVTVFFTAVSILRSYIIRRWFNKPTAEPKSIDKTEWMHCFECEIEMPIKEKDGDVFCSNCGLIHRNFY